MMTLFPIILSRQDDLLFAHLTIPHLQTSKSEENYLINKNLNDYDHNLLNMDKFIGRTIAQLQKQNLNNSTYLILTTDHWLRKKYSISLGSDNTNKIPFIIKKMNDQSFIKVQERFNTVQTRNLIENIFEGKIKSHSDIAKWMKTQTFYSSWNPGPDYHY